MYPSQDDIGGSDKVSTIEEHVYTNNNNITNFQTQPMNPSLNVLTDNKISFRASTTTTSCSIAFYGYSNSNSTETLLAAPQELEAEPTFYGNAIESVTGTPYEKIYFKLGMYVSGTFTVETNYSATVTKVQLV